METPQQNQNGNGIPANTVRKILNNEIAQVISVVVMTYSFIAMVILPISRMAQQIDYIERNHLTHIQDSIAKIEAKNEKQDETDNNIKEKLAEILTLLKQK